MKTSRTTYLLALFFSAVTQAQPRRDVCRIEIEPTIGGEAVQSVNLVDGAGYHFLTGGPFTVTKATMVECPPDVFCYMGGSKKELELVAFSNESPLLQTLQGVYSIRCVTCARGDADENDIVVVQYTTKSGATRTKRFAWGTQILKFDAPEEEIVEAVIKSGPKDIQCAFSSSEWGTVVRGPPSVFFSKREPLTVPFSGARVLICR